MAQFRFSCLPTELRLLIWEAALHQETRNRLAIIDVWSHEVTPVKQLISPLLTVNRESRQVAKAFYTLTLGVWRYSKRPPFSPIQFAGVLHLSLNRDIFVTGMTYQDRTIDYDIPDSAEARVPYYYITESISVEDRGRLRRLLFITYYWDTEHGFRWVCSCYPGNGCICSMTSLGDDTGGEEEYTNDIQMYTGATDKYHMFISGNDEVPADLVKEKRRSNFILDLFTDNGTSKPLRLILPTDSFRKEGELRNRALWDVGYDRDDTFN